jgi:mRNA interferase RelE/StbE
VSSPAPWRLAIAAPARRGLARLPEKAVAAVIETVLAVAANPYRLGKPLRFEFEGLRVARRGPYRVIYDIDEKRHTVTVVAIGHRADVYRRQ